ncbi:sensor histidine kinase [Paenibacillus sp. Leaf72]|uniref:sensor histidine kinase n=1 Tax=Paenibacillus sp. Leaf72 TaxID=1736234 RepID=UPI0006F212D9|nr:sensor histidine kinase [Paenibacillus sp. Leaf72]KQO18376.1 histidine kinase [Paenibacillus sp. Leaf72]
MTVYRNLSIKRKMFLMIFLIMTLIITIAYSSLYYAYSIYDRQLYDKSYRLLNLSSTTIDMELKKLESMSLTIISDSQIQRGLKDLLQDDAEYAGYITRKKITDQLWAHISNAERYVQSVHLIDSRQRVSKYGDSPSFSEEKYARMIKEAVAGKGEVRWLYPDDSDPMLIMVREVRAYEPLTLEPIGILFLRINIERLVEDYAGTASQSSDILLKSGQDVIYPYGQMPEGVAVAFQPLKAGDGYEIKKVNNEPTFLSQKKSSYTGWMYYNIVPYNHIFETVVWLKNSLVIVYSLTFIVVVAIGMAFARSLTRPIRQLISQMKEVQYGDLDSMDASMSAPAFQQMDEVGLLQRTYRMMITRINTLIKENYANQLIIKETEFKALQAQINPHFLYNALDSIHWLAKKNAQQQISSMVVSLGYLLRSSISLKQNVITVAEELETVKHYITIQKYRFQNRLDFHMDVPASCYAAAIPKLTLQPLLENAVQYGLEPMIEPCTIRLYAEWGEGKLALIVEDGGPGMEEAYVQRVLSGEAETRGNGIGILNIKNRIKLAFGESYGLGIDSRAGGGTKVSVLIPLVQED